MEYIIGILLGLGLIVLVRTTGLDRGGDLYPITGIVVASYYPLFAVMGASTETLMLEVIMAAAFSTVAIVGFQRNMGLVALAIGGHGVFDVLRHMFLFNEGVPIWWPGFCASVDILLGLWLAFPLSRGRVTGVERSNRSSRQRLDPSHPSPVR